MINIMIIKQIFDKIHNFLHVAGGTKMDAPVKVTQNIFG